LAKTALRAVKALARAFKIIWPKRPFGPLKPWPWSLKKNNL
jgi:hypothetical protein